MKLLNLFLTIVLLFFNSRTSFSQKINIGIGYNIGTHTKTEGLDFVIGRYNTTRPWLSNKMKNPGFFRGMNYAMDIFIAKFVMSFEWTGRKSEVWARGVSTSGEVTRDFKYYVNSFNFGLGKKIKSKKSGVMGKYFGADFSTITIKNYTRVYKTIETRPPYEKINSEISLGFSPYLMFVGNRFTTKIYYQFMLLDADYWEVNYKINTSTWAKDDGQASLGNTSSLGISVNYNLFKNEKDKKSNGSRMPIN